MKKLFDVNGPDNHMANYVSGIINMIEILFMTKDSLRNNEWDSFQVGAVASEELADDFETAYGDGELPVQEFIKERLFTKSKSIFDTCPKNNRLTFANFQKRCKKRSRQ